MKFGSKYLKDKVAGACLRGEKTICLAITEPSAGSDVANLQTEAKKTPDGKFYIVNGEKKYHSRSIMCIRCATPCWRLKRVPHSF